MLVRACVTRATPHLCTGTATQQETIRARRGRQLLRRRDLAKMTKCSRRRLVLTHMTFSLVSIEKIEQNVILVLFGIFILACYVYLSINYEIMST